MDIQLPNGTILQGVPDGTTQAQITAKLGSDNPVFKAAPAPQTDVGQQFAHGANDSIAGSLAAIPELAAAGMRAIPGIGSSIAPPAGTYQNEIQKGIDWLSGPNQQNVPPAQTGLQKFAYGAGHGTGDALSVAMPAAALRNVAKAGTLTKSAADMLAAQPITQAISGGVGEGTQDATGSQLAGMGAAMATPLAGMGAARLISPGASQLSPEAQRLASLLQNEGVNLTPGQQTGSKPIQITESVLGNLPISSSMTGAENAAQRSAFNKAILSRAGIDATAATPDVLSAGKNVLGSQFDNLTANTTVNLDVPFLKDLAQTAAQYGNKLPTNIKPVFDSYLDDLTKNGTSMPGPVYQQARSDLSRQAKSLATTDPTLSNALRGLRDALDDAAGRSISPDLQDQWQQTRGQYGNLKTIMQAMGQSSAGAAQGDISPAALYQAARGAVGRDQFSQGAGDLNDLARAGQIFIKPQIPDSATAQRTLMQNLLTGSVPTAGFAAGGPAGAAAALATPALVKALMSYGLGKAYLTNQLAAGMGGKITPQLLAAQLAAQSKTPMLQTLEGQQ